MKRNFEFNQTKYLDALTQDISLRRGVCFAMTRDWLLNEMLGTRKSEQYYKQVYRFFSQQRIQNDLWWRSGQSMMTLKSDSHKVIAERRMSRYEGNKIPSENDKQFYFIVLFNGAGFTHCMGVSVLGGIYRAFDANFGEFEQPCGNESLSKMMLQGLVMEHYSHETSPHLIVNHLALK